MKHRITSMADIGETENSKLFKIMKEMKTYIKVKPKDEDWWVCSLEDFKTSVEEWCQEFGTLTISVKRMTEDEFNKIPEI